MNALSTRFTAFCLSLTLLVGCGNSLPVQETNEVNRELSNTPASTSTSCSQEELSGARALLKEETKDLALGVQFEVGLTLDLSGRGPGVSFNASGSFACMPKVQGGTERQLLLLSYDAKRMESDQGVFSQSQRKVKRTYGHGSMSGPKVLQKTSEGTVSIGTLSVSRNLPFFTLLHLDEDTSDNLQKFSPNDQSVTFASSKLKKRTAVYYGSTLSSQVNVCSASSTTTSLGKAFASIAEYRTDSTGTLSGRLVRNSNWMNGPYHTEISVALNVDADPFRYSDANTSITGYHVDLAPRGVHTLLRDKAEGGCWLD